MNKLITFAALTSFLMIEGCSAPPLKYYTFNEDNQNKITNQINHYSTSTPTVIITPVTVPDYLDTTDIVTRNNTDLHHSINGRMSSVLSIGITDFITRFLADQNPNLFITNQRQIGEPSSQILINIRRLDVEEQANKNGYATLEADWSIIPNNEQRSIDKRKGTFVAKGSIAQDSDVIKLEQNLLIQLAQQINKNALY